MGRSDLAGPGRSGISAVDRTASGQDRPSTAQLGRESSPGTNSLSRSMRLVPSTFDDQRLALWHGTPPYLNWDTGELGPPGVYCRLSRPMPAQDLAGGWVHDFVDGARAWHSVSLPEDVWPVPGPAERGGSRPPDLAPVQRPVTSSASPLATRTPGGRAVLSPVTVAVRRLVRELSWRR